MPDSQDIAQVIAEIHELALKLPATPGHYGNLSDLTRGKLRRNLEAILQKLEKTGLLLDPISLPETVFDPTAPKVVAKLVADTLLFQKRRLLRDLDEARFYGAGVYALYYTGDFECYRPISGKDHPIYVGKADPKELHAGGPREQGDKLSARLREHAKSIKRTANLDINDFDCRYLVVRSAWVETAENNLIAHFKPIWNKEMKVCQGFGKHGDAPATRANKRSAWDTLHPGREWATRPGNTPGIKSAEEIKAAIHAHFLAFPPG